MACANFDEVRKTALVSQRNKDYGHHARFVVTDPQGVIYRVKAFKV